MTKANKVLFITQEITPYVPETELSLTGRNLPQAIQEKGREIRTFMPKWGNINERRNQLHEVIRLSGMNLIIDDTDHPLIIKVASIQSARMQVYFIDNDDFFQNRLQITDENGVEYEDNDARTIFYARGVLETVKKLRWCPDIIHCHGWMTALAPLYIKRARERLQTKLPSGLCDQADAEGYRQKGPRQTERTRRLHQFVQTGCGVFRRSHPAKRTREPGSARLRTESGKTRVGVPGRRRHGRPLQQLLRPGCRNRTMT